MSTLILAEHRDQKLSASTLSTIGAAQKLGKDIDILVLGAVIDPVVEVLKSCSGVTRILSCGHTSLQNDIAEALTPTILKCLDQKSYTHVLAPATTFGKNILPRIAALKNVGQISDVIEIIDEKTFIRPIYAGNALTTVESLDPLKVMTIRTTAFERSTQTGGNVKVETIEFSPPQTPLPQFISLMESKSDRPDLTSASIVVSGGRALQSQENFKIIEALADTLGAAIGASRAAVDAGYVPNDYQVGQTGKVVAPDLYIAIGISGAIQHLAGMKDSKVIVAINKDPEAPIFQIADYGLVGDLFQIVPELTQKLQGLRKAS
ncbi:Electron transfer flavoprotein subunit alpha [Candidatus Bealeia paramacronuclearis]|uniref:Electron transfer flavoprotein subunit alpha n=1 Tax=Candidatus Bealeia paramacronuclearis TaxID=1921001 RepID=A0ABZ2C3A2_9PROT|nr:Electron transfer flavoprotein subunit alpha [Candidatus Bealeia paramacronuclearis]